VKERDEGEKDEASVSLACEKEQCGGSHLQCDQSNKEGCKCVTHKKGLIQESVSTIRQEEEEAMEMEMEDVMGLGQRW
jgi:hypothetical protein